MIDTSKAFDVASAPTQSTARKPSFTESAGRSAFEDALSKSRSDEKRWEAGLSAPSPVEVQRQSEPFVADEILLTTERGPIEPTGRDKAVRNEAVRNEAGGQAPVRRATDDEEVGPAVAEAAGRDEEQEEAASRAETIEAAEASEENTAGRTAKADVGEGAFALDAQEWDSEGEQDAAEASDSDVAEVDAEQLASGSQDPAGEEMLGEGQAQAETQSLDVDGADITFEVASGQAASVAEPSGASVPTPVAPTAPTLVESFGRQAFARSTQMQKAGAASPASLDMDDLVDQIAKVRGSMSTGRARVVVGEGSERLELTVLLRNGTVNIDARAVDASMAQSLAKGSAELSEALGKHGLSLGTMDTGGAGDGATARGDDSEAGESRGLAEAVSDTGAADPQTPRRGVRIVA